MANKKRMLIRHVVDRKPGFLYYIDREGNLWEVEMSRGGRKKGTTLNKLAKIDLAEDK